MTVRRAIAWVLALATLTAAPSAQAGWQRLDPATNKVISPVAEGSFTRRVGRYGRSFGDAGPNGVNQPDAIESTTTTQWPNETVPDVADQIATVDGLSHITEVDASGTARGRDALGNTSSLELEDGWATLVHDGLSRARVIQRANGIIVRYGYRADGVRVSRQIECLRYRRLRSGVCTQAT